jgi:hypothetical protein
MKHSDNNLMYSAQESIKSAMEFVDKIKTQPYSIEASIEDIYGKLEDINHSITVFMGDDQ